MRPTISTPKSTVKTTSSFAQDVIKWVRKIPRGKVVTYGQIAALAGKPHGARGVAWILHSCTESYKLPWQRVVNSKGGISFPWNSAAHREQAQLLRAEGIEVLRGLKSSTLDLLIYQWHPKEQPRRQAKCQPKRSEPSMFC